jgi:hypothetical protein
LLLILPVAAGPALGAATAAGDPGAQCAVATRRAEQSLGLPSGLLQAIALTESGRWDSAGHRSFAWPWTVTSGEDGGYFDSKEEALARIDDLRRAGRSNIDVGCMQVNLHHHPDAFGDLGQALDPARNVAYGAALLAELEEQTQSWDLAIERYHSSDPARGHAYRERVLENWRRIRDDPVASADPDVVAAWPTFPAPARATPGLPVAAVHASPRATPAEARASGPGVWHWLTPAGSFPIAAIEEPRPLVFAGPEEAGRGALVPGLVRVAARPPG